MAHRIHQPGLTPGVLPEFRKNSVIKGLPRLFRVLLEELFNFRVSEIPHPQ